MAEDNAPDKDQKVHDPTPKRLEDAYKRGQIPFSKDLVNWCLLLTILGLLAIGFPFAIKKSWVVLASLFQSQTLIEFSNAHQLEHYLKITISAFMGPWLIIFMIIMLVPILVGLGQSFKGIGMTNLKPKFSRLSPMQGLKKIFSKQSIYELTKSILKIIMIGLLFWFIFKDQLHEATIWLWGTPYELMLLTKKLLIKYLAMLAAIYCFISIIDVFYQRYTFWQSLKMTLKELRDESKEQEGDPKIKAKIRELQRRRSNRQMLSAVPTASVVITNPTHFAVALFWEENSSTAPKVVAKGADFMALTIRQIASDNKVPVINNPPVTRSIYDSVPLNQFIPPEFYKVIAEILRLAFKIRRTFS